MNRTKGSANPRWKGGRTVSSRGYALVLEPDHNRANGGGYVFEHILIAERVLGKPLPPGAQIHHVNQKCDDNRNCNLVICQDQAYHRLLHRRQRALDATGNASWLKCHICKVWAPPEAFARWNSNRPNPSFFHKRCRVAAERRLRQLHKKQARDGESVDEAVYAVGLRERAKKLCTRTR